MKASDRCKNLIRESEGLRLEPYRCPAGVWTIGYGHTHNVKPTDLITKIRAEKYLDEDIAKAEQVVNDSVHRKLSQGQFDALVDFVFNLGGRKFKKSTLFRKLNAGKPDDEICREIGRWVYGGGEVLPGLKKRRDKEIELWMEKE